MKFTDEEMLSMWLGEFAAGQFEGRRVAIKRERCPVAGSVCVWSTLDQFLLSCDWLIERWYSDTKDGALVLVDATNARPVL